MLHSTFVYELPQKNCAGLSNVAYDEIKRESINFRNALDQFLINTKYFTNFAFAIFFDIINSKLLFFEDLPRRVLRGNQCYHFEPS
jgi:hypothetical protein